MAKIRKKRASKYDNIEVGTKFGDYTVIEKGAIRSKWGQTFLLCRCRCGSERKVNTSNLANGTSKRCFTCRMSNSGNLLNSEGSKNRKAASIGHAKIKTSWWARYGKAAEKRNYSFNITPDYVWSIYEEQDMKCRLSGVKIDFSLDVRDPSYPSMDRIDNERGYEVGNIQLVTKTINYMKRTLSQDEFISLCTRVHRKAP